MKDGVKARYTLEFKREAVRLAHSGEKVSAVARTLGVSGQSLDNWVKAEAAGRLRDVRGKAVTAEQMEIARLKAELSRVRMERNILKKRWWVQPVDATALISSCRGGFGMARTGRPGRSWFSAVSCKSAPAAILSTNCGKLRRLARTSHTAGSATRPLLCTSRLSSPR